MNYQDTLPGSTHWSLLARRGVGLRLTDPDGGANCAMLLYNPSAPLERYNAPDTLKCQHTFKLTAGHCLYSDMGRIFASIIADDCGWHDTVCGNLSDAALAARWGELSYQTARNGRTLSGHRAFLVELAKHGLGERDMAANVNLFSRVEADGDGGLHYRDGRAPGRSVTLRFEMDTLVVLHTCPHPLDRSPEYPRHPVIYELFEAGPPGPDDVCRNHCEENQRGFRNNELWHLGLERHYPEVAL